MGRKTQFLNLHLADANDVYDVEVDQNQNFEKIDKKLKELDTGKEPIINKKTGFNLDKTDEYDLDDKNKLGTARALKRLFDEIVRRIGLINWNSLTGKPNTFPPSGHSHTWSSLTEKPNFNSSVTSNSTTEFATPSSVKTAYDRGSTALAEANKKEPKFNKNTAFNKSFGTTAGTVLEGKNFGIFYRPSSFVKNLWKGRYLAPNNNTSPLVTLPSDWEVCFVAYEWNSSNLSGSIDVGVLTKHNKGVWYHAPGSYEWGEARFLIDTSNRFISQGRNTSGNDCYIIKIDYI